MPPQALRTEPMGAHSQRPAVSTGRRRPWGSVTVKTDTLRAPSPGWCGEERRFRGVRGQGCRPTHRDFWAERGNGQVGSISGRPAADLSVCCRSAPPYLEPRSGSRRPGWWCCSVGEARYSSAVLGYLFLQPVYYSPGRRHLTPRGDSGFVPKLT